MRSFLKTTPQAYHQHLQAEQRKRSKSTDTRLRDPSAIINLYERAIAHVATLKVDALLALANLGEHSASQDLQAAEAWLHTFWVAYIAFLVR